LPQNSERGLEMTRVLQDLADADQYAVATGVGGDRKSQQCRRGAQQSGLQHDSQQAQQRVVIQPASNRCAHLLQRVSAGAIAITGAARNLLGDILTSSKRTRVRASSALANDTNPTKCASGRSSLSRRSAGTELTMSPS
jgi:hypothetical protein